MKTIIKKTARNLILAITLLFAFSSCGANNSKGNANNILVNETKDAFLNDKQGKWLCYKYEFEDIENAFAESYAKEFIKYAYFIICDDTLSAVGTYNTPVYSYKYPVQFKKYEDESVFITSLKPSADSVFFIAPFNPYEYYWENSDNLPYYKDAPMNKTHFFWNDNFVINDRGYFFFFKKGERKNDNIKGVPGDNRNYFRVEKVYENVLPKEILQLIEKDFPHGFEQVIDAVNKEIFWRNDWGNNNMLKLEKSQSNGKFIMEIVAENNNVRLLYCLVDDSEDEEY